VIYRFVKTIYWLATVIIGTSHADGSFRNCGISIQMSYCIDSNGEPIFISKSDIRTRIVNLSTKEVDIAINVRTML